MSEPVTTWQPLIDFDEADRRITELETAHRSEAAARAERFRLIGGRISNASKTANQDVPVLSAPDSAVETASDSPLSAISGGPVIGGDFAEIEAALLRTALLSVAPSEVPREPRQWGGPILRASRADAAAEPFNPYAAFSIEAPEPADMQASLLSAAREEPFPEAGAPSETFMLFDDAAVSGSAAMADEDKRSRRPLYIMAALVFAGVAGIAATSFRNDGAVEVSQEALRLPVFAPGAAENGAAPASQEAASVAGGPTQQQASLTQDAPPIAASASIAPAPADAAPVAAFSEPVAAPEPPVAHSGATVAAAPDTSILAPPPVAKTPALPSIGAAKKVKTAAVRPDGSLIKAESPAKTAAPKVALNKDIPAGTSPGNNAPAKPAQKAAHLNPPQFGAATPSGTTKSAKAAAKPAQVAVKAKPAPAADAQAAQTAPAADAQAVAAAPKPTGPLAFVDTAVSSITGATGKLFDWGHTASGAH